MVNCQPWTLMIGLVLVALIIAPILNDFRLDALVEIVTSVWLRLTASRLTPTAPVITVTETVAV